MQGCIIEKRPIKAAGGKRRKRIQEKNKGFLMHRLATLFLLLLLLPLQGQAVTFKIATLAPDSTPWMNAMREGAEEVEKNSNGRVKIRFYPGGVMGNDKSMLRKIRAGQLHGCTLTGGGLTSIYPDSQLYSLPFLFRSFEEVDYVRERMDPIFLQGMEKEGYVSFGLSEGGFAYFMSQNPLSSVDDLKQQKVWAPEGDEIARQTFAALGVSPIPLPMTDVLTGLQTGLIDTVETSPVGAIALQWHTRVKYLADTPLLYLYATLVVKKSAFDRLSKEDQEVMRTAMAKAFRKINEQNRKDNAGARKALQEQGITFIAPTAEDLAKWRGLMADKTDEMGEQGLFSRELLKQLRGHLRNYRATAKAD
jgi:TRAP-type C4-dicarboxylate transport system substrate-binding protein